MAMLKVIVLVMVKVIALSLSPGHWSRSATRVSNNFVLKNLVLVSENLVSQKIAEYRNWKHFHGFLSRIPES